MPTQLLSDIQVVAAICDMICDKKNAPHSHLSDLEKRILELGTDHLTFRAEEIKERIKVQKQLRKISQDIHKNKQHGGNDNGENGRGTDS